MNTIDVLAIDPGLLNTGLALLRIDVNTEAIEVLKIELIQTEKEQGKQVRVNSDDLRRTTIVAQAMFEWAASASLVMAEIPSGAQNARAATSFGICTGVLGALGIKHKIIQVQPGERGKAVLGRKTVTKEQVIHWA
ncbi:MAG: hypothetical protein ACRYGR_08675, partial [Janthinobacterium lividum]